MHKRLGVLFLLFAACSSKVDEKMACLPSDQLIASTEPMHLPIAQVIDPLTKDDIQRLDRHFPDTLDKIAKMKRLDYTDIIHLTRAGVSDAEIIEIIEKTKSQFFLSHVNEQQLRQAGVSNRVISVMMSTADPRY